MSTVRRLYTSPRPRLVVQVLSLENFDFEITVCILKRKRKAIYWTPNISYHLTFPKFADIIYRQFVITAKLNLNFACTTTVKVITKDVQRVTIMYYFI